MTARGAWGTSGPSLLLAAYLLLVANVSFWKSLWRAIGVVSISDLPLMFAVAAMLLALFWMLFGLLAWRHVAKPAWITLIALAFTAAYFMDSYGLVVDRVAIQSVIETDPREASEWLSVRMLPYLAAALIPTLWLLRLRLRFRTWPRELVAKMLMVVVVIAVIGPGVLLNFQRLSSLARNNRQLQHLINPTTVLQSTYGYARRLVAPRPAEVVAIHTDAHRGASWSVTARPRVLVLVIGESARASSFSLLGYERTTNPRLAAIDTFNFSNVHSCGTSTAVSLPCMFSDLGEEQYSDLKARGRESLLDVLGHAGLRSLWVDNNTGSKDVAARSGQVSVADAQDPDYCNAVGCFDDILVDRLRSLLDQPDTPTVIVLHQKGSHGPSYFERYPPEFRRFQPTCDSNELEDCTREQIVNTYDNTILYTDHNLAEIVAVLREHEEIDSAMLYVSDHGESTGERGMYLHGAPSFIAPDEQTRVPMIVWLSSGYASHHRIDHSCMQSQQTRSLSHDHLFHSVLGLMDVATQGYRSDRDLFATCRIQPVDELPHLADAQ